MPADTPQLSLKNIEMSSKIRAVINTLRALPVFDASTSSSDQVDGSNSSGRRTEKAIVFSQWTSMLDLLESSLKKEGFCYRRLDGTMSIQARDRALSDFKQLPDVSIYC
jgi:SNF2 family DNA or RNA helicase